MRADWRAAPSPQQVARHAAAHTASDGGGWWLTRARDGGAFDSVRLYLDGGTVWAEDTSRDGNDGPPDAVWAASQEWTPLGADGVVPWGAADDVDPVTRVPRSYAGATHFRNVAGEVRERLPCDTTIEGVLRLRAGDGSVSFGDARDWTPVAVWCGAHNASDNAGTP